jgi:hypothetical protein
MTDKSMAKMDDDDDLDALIDRAVDTFFVEAPSPDEVPELKTVAQAKTTSPKQDPQIEDAPSFDEALENLFTGSFDGSTQSTVITSGDDETDRAIDLAVDTLFVEEPETQPPETAQLEIKAVEANLQEIEYEFIDPVPEPVKPKVRSEPPRAPEVSVRSGHRVQRPETDTKPKTGIPDAQKSQDVSRKKDTNRITNQPVISGSKSSKTNVSYDDAMAQEIERHIHTIYEEQTKAPSTTPKPDVGRPKTKHIPATHGVSPLRKLQEAILTLEWEISKRSVTVLANELQKVRLAYRDNVVVDFAALSMRIVLDYLVKRMSKAHPESIRFLLEITDYLDRSLHASEEDPLRSFHHIMTRYERYKSTVRFAEGLRDAKPPILDQLEISDLGKFSDIVDQQTKTIMLAGQSLAKRMAKTHDPENLIRSFRLLVTRSVNRILENTHKSKPKTVKKTKTRS